MNTLIAKDITKKFDEVVALHDLSLTIEKGCIVGLIGPNGSGKTTFIDIVTGFSRLDDGQLFFEGRRLDGLRPHEIARLGIGRSFQETRVFRKMTVMENLLSASSIMADADPKSKSLNLLKLIGLSEFKDHLAGTLSYGQQKLVEFARMLMCDPQLILLDEPMAGINFVLIEQLLAAIKELQQRGNTIIIVEHNMRVISAICEKVIVLEHGEKIAEGMPSEIQNNVTVRDAYLGYA